MPDLSTDVRFIKGIGEKRAAALAKLGILALRDLICHFPRAYEDRRNFSLIRDLSPGEVVSVRATIATEPRASFIRRGLDLLKFRAVDESGSLDIVFFNQTYLKKQIKLGDSYVFYGKVGDGTGRALGGTLTMQNPVLERDADTELDNDSAANGRFTGRIVPIYRLTQGVGQAMLTSAIADGLTACGDAFPDPLPAYLVREQQLAAVHFAYHNIHFPENEESLEIARRRFIFEELFLLTTALQCLRVKRDARAGCPIPTPELAPFLAALPFTLTTAQRRAIDDVLADLNRPTPMARLIQGDVGSGKTVIAAAAVWAAFLGGHQSAFMAPTEILAQQHFDTLSNLLTPFGVRTALLTGRRTPKQKRELGELIASGHFHLIVGTHALLSESVRYHKLGLVIADEQHRFGVEQRSALTEKGDKPHVLVMSATPIPRTLSLILYGDLDVSVINELPPGRQTIDTFTVDEAYRARIYAFTKKLLDEGRQAFFVCPAVQSDPEDMSNGLKAVEEYAKELKESVFPGRTVAFLHGKLKAAEKEKTMTAFAAGEIDILVATTVIEVGIDVPNAALMVIENAEQFGLSQLHQLRGRVGRGAHKSYCVLFSDKQNDATAARLKTMCKTNDGFKIAEADLAQRGPGDFFGARQHGLPEMRLGSLQYNMDILHSASAASAELLARDPALAEAEHRNLRQKIEELFDITVDTLN